MMLEDFWKRFNMEYKKFLEYFAKFSLGVFILGGIYTIGRPKTKSVTNYKLTDDISYTGDLDQGKFQGKGVLKAKEGIYKGDFDKGRIGKNGVYIGDNFYYIKENGQVKIKFNDGRIYKKKDGKWEEVEDEN